MESSRSIKPIRANTKPLLLKDHLLDDMSSCSSNGFKSFPRRQCCTTVRFRHEFDRKAKQRRIDFEKPPSKSALSALITAVRRLPFVAAKASEGKRKSNFNSFLPRSFSRRMFVKGSFWKRKPEQKKWKSFDQLLKEEPLPSDCSITTTDDRKSCRSTAEEVRNDAVVVEPVEEVSDGGDGVSNDDVSLESTTTTSSDGSSDTNSTSTEAKKEWSSDQEKEQCSPVSVLDCPFDDYDEEVSSPFQHRLARMEGTRKRLLKKIQKFECLAKLEPVNLTNRFSSEPDSDNESSTSLDEEDEEEEEGEDEEEEEEEAMKLLDQMKLSMSSHDIKLKAERLLLDFFREKIASDQQHCTSVDKQRGISSFHDELVEIAEDWINEAKPREMFMEWEVERNRQAYVEDMEKCGEWKRIDQENEEVGLELGNEVFDSLLNEVLLDITKLARMK